jgi:hypothetical protein
VQLAHVIKEDEVLTSPRALPMPPGVIVVSRGEQMRQLIPARGVRKSMSKEFNNTTIEGTEATKGRNRTTSRRMNPPDFLW